MSILNVDKIQPIGGGSTITVDATDIQASTGTITANSYTGVDNTLKVSIGGTEYVRTHSTGQVSIGSTFMWRTDTVAQVYGKSPDLSLSRFNDQFMISGNETSGAINTGAGIQFFGHDGVQERGMAYIRGLKENGTSGNRASYLAFATRPASGTLEERLRINSSGQVLIGTTTAGYGEGDDLTIATNGHTGITIRGGTSSDCNIYFADGTSGNDQHQGIIQYRHSLDALRFFTNAGERLRIDSSGRVMIGTTAASTLTSTDDLTISTSGSTGITLFSAAGNAGNITFGDGTSGDDRQRGLLQYHHLDNSMRFFTNAVRRMTIDSTGRVLIGVDAATNNDSYVQAFKPTGNDATITVGNVATSASGLCRYDFAPSNKVVGSRIECHASEDFSTTANRTADLVFITRKDGTLSEKLRIKSDGKVGINQTSPRTTLDVSGYVFLGNGGQIQITGSSGAKGLQLAGADDGNNIIGTMGSSGENLLFRTASSERMRLLVGGPHLLIGGTSGMNEITESSSNAGLVIGNTSMGNGGLAIVNSTSGTGRIYFGDATGSNVARNRGQINYYHNGDYMLFATAGSERLRIDSNGNVTKPTSFHILVDRQGNQTGYNASNISDVIIWNRVQTGQSSSGAASHFDTSTGLFTAPVTGLYHFHVSVNCSYNVQGAWLNINGSRPNHTAFYPNGSQSADGMITYKVTAGQTVGVKWYYNGQTNGTINSNNYHTWWRIVLLG